MITRRRPFTVEKWNSLYPPGTPVTVYPATREDPGIDTFTRSTAWMLGHGAPVVKVDSLSGGFYLAHIDVRRMDCPVCFTGDDPEDCEHQGFPYTELFSMHLCKFVCSVCFSVLEGQPCPTHAPMEIPGLRRVECDATPPHAVMFSHLADDYGHPCPYCQMAPYIERDRLARQCRHRAWRRQWRLLNRIDRYILRPLRLTNGSTWSNGDGHDGCVTFHWRRPW